MRKLTLLATLLILGCSDDDNGGFEVLPPAYGTACYQLQQVNGQYAVVGDGVKVRMVDANGQPAIAAPLWTLRRREFIE